MNKTEKYQSFDTSVIHYVKTGNGPENLLLFHGFGQDNRVFDPLAHELAPHYTIYSFDLFFHGKSLWLPSETPLEKAVWKKIMADFFLANKIERFSLAGFSLGGKFVLSTIESYPEMIERAFLIAPDGIKTGFWYSLATYPVLFRKLFKSMILHPTRFFMLAKAAYTLKLADRGLLRFAEYQMMSETRRNQVYSSWVVFRHLKFNMKEIARILNSQNIPLTFILGKFDKVIKPANMNRLVKRLRNCTVNVLETGHNGLLEPKRVSEIFKKRQ